MRILLLPIVIILSSVFSAFGQCDSVRIVANIEKECQPAVVTYHLENPPANATYLWDVGNGPEISSDTFYKLHRNAGVIDITSEITFSNGSKCLVEEKGIVEVLANPKPDFAVSRNLFCNGPDTVTIKDLTPNVAQRTWVVDGTSYNNSGVERVHKLVTVGTKNISLIVKGTNGCDAVVTKEDVITVYPGLKFDFKADKTKGCKPQDISFSINNLKDSLDIASYVWQFPGATEELDAKKNPTSRVYRNAGFYDVNLQLETTYGCAYQHTKKSYIKIGDTAELSLMLYTGTLCMGDSIKFGNPAETHDGGKYTWKVTGMDNDTFTNRNELVVLPKDTGYLDIEVTYVYNGCVSNSTFKDAAYVNGVKANLFSDDHYHCEVPHTVNLKNRTNTYGANSVGYQWHILEDGVVIDSAGTEDASFTFYTIPATYDVRLVALSSNGCVDTMYRRGFIYQDSLKLDLDVIPEIACLEQEVRFLNRTRPSSYMSTDKFKWYFYDLDGTSILDSSTQRSPKYSYSRTGYYDIKLIGANGINCRDTLEVKNAVYVVKPELAFNLSDSILCKGENIVLEGVSKPAIAPFKYDWFIKNKETGKVTSFTNKPTVNTKINTAGEYTLIVKHRIADGCEMYDSSDIHINGLELEIVLDTLGGCSPLDVNATLTISENKYFGGNSEDISVKWFVNPNKAFSVDSDTVLAPKFILAEDADYRLSVTAFNSAGCKDQVTSDKLEVGVRARFNVLNPVVCLGDVLRVQNTADNSTDIDWAITPTIATQETQNNNIFTFSIPRDGNFNITQYANRNKKCFDTLTKRFEVVEVIANFAVVDSLLNCAPVFAEFESTSKNGDTLFWDYGDGNRNVTTEISSGHVYEKNSGFSKGFDLQLVAKSVHGCTDTLLKPDYVVVQGPVPNFEVENITGCDPLEVNFLDNTVDATTLFYVYGDGSELNRDIKQGEAHSYVYRNTLPNQNSQLYVPALIAFDSLGCVAEFQTLDTIEVFKKPEISVAVNSTNKTCIPFELSFSSLTRFTSEYQWLLDQDTLFKNENGKAVIETLGTKKLELKAQNEIGCRDSISQDVLPLESPIVNLFTPDSICEQEIFNALVNVQALEKIKDINWDFSKPSSFRITDLIGLNFNLGYNIPGPKTLALEILLENGCAAGDTQSIYITNEQDIDEPPIEVVSVEDNYTIQLLHKSSTYNKFNEYHYWSPIEIRVNDQKRDTLQHFTSVNQVSDSVCFDVRVKDECDLFGTRSPKHCTVFLTAESQKAYEAELSWSPYVGWSTVDKYNIYRNDGAGWTYLTAVPGNQLNYTDKKLCNQNYGYRVEAVHPDGSLTSKSNSVAIEPIYTLNVSNTHVSNVSVTAPNEITVRWQHSTFSEFDVYKLYKYKEDETEPIASYTLTTTDYIDSEVSTDQFSYRYEVVEVDRCGNRTDRGRFGKSILLKGYYDKASFIDWSAYAQYENGVQDYKVEIQTSSGFMMLERTSAQDLSFVDKEYHRDIYGEYCYRVTATSGGVDSSLSNVVCVSTEPVLLLPNAFTPNNNGLNEVFRPVAQFAYDGVEFKPTSYDFIILNRWGEIMFRTNDMRIGWDGTYKNKPAQQGTYIYQLKAQGTDNRFIYKEGSVMLLR